MVIALSSRTNFTGELLNGYRRVQRLFSDESVPVISFASRRPLLLDNSILALGLGPLEWQEPTSSAYPCSVPSIQSRADEVIE